MTPQYGQPQPPTPRPKKNRGCLIASVAAAIAGLLLLGSCGVLLVAIPDTTGNPGSTQPADAGDGEAKSAKIGESARDGNFTFTVTKTENGPNQVGGPYGVEAQGRYVYVHVTVKNHGDDARTFDSSSQLGLADGKEYQADGEAQIYLDDSEAFLNDINPGNKVDGTLIFDVPKGTDLTAVELHDSALSGGVRVDLS